MKNNEIFLPQDIYSTYLKTIGDIQLTQREIDVIGFFVCGRSSKKTASSLSIAPKTVEYHTRNILLKLQCNSREGIIDFIEKSKKLSHIRKYHSSKLAYGAFKNSLKSIATLTYPNKLSCVMVYWPQQSSDSSLVHFLKEAFSHLDIVISLKTREDLPSLSQLVKEQKSKDYVIYILPSMNDALFIKKTPPAESQSNTLFLFSQDDLPIDDPKNPHPPHFLNLATCLNMYFAFFEILKKLFPHLEIEKIISNFQEQYEIMQDETVFKDSQDSLEESNKTHNKKELIFRVKGILAQRKWQYLSGGVLFVSAGIGFLTLQGFEKRNQTRQQNQSYSQGSKEESMIRSDMVIPNNSTLLNRSELITQIDNKFNKQEGIKTIALIGIGGAGKTTLAHQYAQSQNIPIVWEMNAETPNSLKESFENLAFVLAKTEEDQIKLRTFQEIKNPLKREEKIIQFTKNKLKSHNNWFLIYDNVEKFTDIHKYFPQDSHTWGQGKIILTTRDSHIQNNIHIKDALLIEELDQEQKLSLFLAIIENGIHQPLTSIQKEKTKKFLEGIPSFPLDVSVAAYYLKATNIAYQAYLEKSKDYNKDFENVQKNILEESSNYNKTRYNIITLSLKNLIDTHEDFKDLLLLLSLLDSQNIPVALLKAYKNDAVVERFIYSLKKYSLLLNNPSTFSPEISAISIHRSTQQIALSYLSKTLNLKDSHSLQELSKFLERYANGILEKQDISKMKVLVSHYERYLMHDLLPEEIKNPISAELGYIYLYLSSDQKAQEIFETTLENLNKKNKKDYDKIAHILVGLGRTYKELGDHKKAKEVIEHSLIIYNKYFPENFKGIAKGMGCLGSIYRKLGNYAKARELYEQCLIIYKKHFPQSYFNIAQVLARLGNVYRSLGQYEMAIDLFEESLTIYKRFLFKNHSEIAWAAVHLGNVYGILGRYKEAKDLLEQALRNYKEALPENRFRYAWTLALLGEIHRNLGNYEKAKDLLEEGLKLHQELFPEKYIEMAWVSIYLGNLYREIGYYKKANVMLEKSFDIYKQYYDENHLKTAWVLLNLGNLSKDLGQYEKSRDLLECSLAIYKKYLPDNHIHIAFVSAPLGHVNLKLNQHEKAKKLLEDSHKIYERYYAKDHIETTYALLNLGKAYFYEGNLNAANEAFNLSLKIFRQSKHPNRYRGLESLADFYLKNFIQLENKKDLNQSQSLKIQAASLLKEALEIVQTHFPKDSDHLIRLQNKLDSQEQ